MKLTTVLSPEVVKVGLKGTDKNSIIEEMLDTLVAAGKINDRDRALADLLDRESKMSTGIQHGIAIPHAKTSAVDSLVACIGIKKEGIDFKSLDGKPSSIFIMTLSPMYRVGPHVQFLAEISTLIKTESSRKALAAAENAEQVLAVFGM